MRGTLSKIWCGLSVFCKRDTSSRTRAASHNNEKDSSWYDSVYESSDAYRCHYTQSRYYFIWTVIADRIRRSANRRVLEIGCGSGQLAALLYDQGIKEYVGFDFSEAAVHLARQAVPSYTFLVADARSTELVVDGNYDWVVCTEVLEHIVEDLAVVQRIPSGKRFIGTVPNFPYRSHVRHFFSSGEVVERYANFFNDFDVIALAGTRQGQLYFLFEGVRASTAARESG